MHSSVNGYVLATALIASLAAAASEKPSIVVQAPDSPVKLDHATVVMLSDGPPVLVYAATNTTNDALDQFTVIAYVFDAEGNLKARQTAPARRTLEAHETKTSTLVLDGGPVTPTDQIVIGVNQAQRVGSENWWRAELQVDAEKAVPRTPAKK
jgi:hypothetical protein